MEREGLVANAAEVGQFLGQCLGQLAAHPTVGDVRGLGMLWGVEFVADKEQRTAIDRDSDRPRFAITLQGHAWRRGLFVDVSTLSDKGRLGCVVAVAPPLVAERGDVDGIVDRLDDALTATEQELGFR